MAEVKTFQEIPIVAAGLSLAVDVTQYTDYLITGTGTLSGSVTITPIGIPAFGTVCTFKYEGNWVLGSNNISIFGRVLNQQEASSKCVITCRWDDTTSTWIVDVQMSDNAQYVGKVLAESTDPTPGFLSAKFGAGLDIDATNHQIKLKGAVLAPGPNTYYGTDPSGNRVDLPMPSNFGSGIESNWIQINGVSTLGSVPVVLPTTYMNIRKIVVTGKRVATGWTPVSSTRILIKGANGASVTNLATVPITVLETNSGAYGYNTEYAVITAPVTDNEIFTIIIVTTNDGADLSGGDYTLWIKIYYEPIIQMP